MNFYESAKTPILFLIFNRPDYTRQVFEKIRLIKPSQLFVAADGPRPHNVFDMQNCEQARAIINSVDWQCEVTTLFRDHNLGCGLAVSSAISWFFNHVEQGIILEDDCVPDPAFFSFASELLQRYAQDPRIMMIAGSSFLLNQEQCKQSYFFSRFYPIWGWATWRRAWQHYDFELSSWDRIKKTTYLDDFFENKTIVQFWRNYFDRIHQKQIDTWDIQWVYSCIMKNAFAVAPMYNLISNIGLSGAHGNGIKSYLHEMPIVSINSPLVHPAQVISDRSLDKKTYTNVRVLGQQSWQNMVKDLLRPAYKYCIKVIQK